MVDFVVAVTPNWNLSETKSCKIKWKNKPVNREEE